MHPQSDESLKVAENTVLRSDPLQLVLEVEWYRQQRSKLHGHVCQSCLKLRPCCADPCPYRATEKEREWECGC